MLGPDMSDLQLEMVPLTSACLAGLRNDQMEVCRKEKKKKENNKKAETRSLCTCAVSVESWSVATVVSILISHLWTAECAQFLLCFNYIVMAPLTVSIV